MIEQTDLRRPPPLALPRPNARLQQYREAGQRFGEWWGQWLVATVADAGKGRDLAPVRETILVEAVRQRIAITAHEACSTAQQAEIVAEEAYIVVRLMLWEWWSENIRKDPSPPPPGVWKRSADPAGVARARAR